MAGIKQLRSWFFGITSELRADGTVGGVRLRKTDKPTQQTFENLLESTAFKTESGDRARVSTGATIGSEQGLSVLANDVQAKANSGQLSDRSLVTQPHQLPTIETIANSAVEDMPLTGLFIQTGGATTRNQYQIRFLGAWLTWLVSRIFKQGGVEGDVPIKTSGVDYAWSYGNVGDNTTTVNKIANNTTFISTLTANASFATALQTTINNIITSTPSYFTETLEVGFMRVHPIVAMPSVKWVRCDGTSYATATYPALFALIGYTYGGVGANFNVPDFRDKQITGYSGTKTIASTGGAETHTIASANLPTHTHGAGTLAVSGGEHGHTWTNGAPPRLPIADTKTAGADAFFAGSGALTTDVDSGSGSHTHTFSGSTDNGGFANTAINHLDPYLASNIIIKVLA